MGFAFKADSTDAGMDAGERAAPTVKRTGRCGTVPATRISASAALLMGLACSGCNARHSRTIAFIPETTGTEIWEAAHRGAEISAERYGYSIYWNAPSREDDVERQITLIEEAARSRNAGLIVAPHGYLALISIVREIQSKNIPIVILRSPLPISGSTNLKYILNDEEQTGLLAAQRLGSVLGGKGTIAIIGANPEIYGIEARAVAFESVLSVRYPKINIVDRRGGSGNIAQLQETAEEILQAHQHLDAIFALTTNASEASLAALRAFKMTGKVRLIGCDQEVGLMASVRRGEIDSIIVENSYQMGYRAVEWLAKRKEGIVDSGEVRIAPVLVTRANIDDSNVQSILAVNWRP